MRVSCDHSTEHLIEIVLNLTQRRKGATTKYLLSLRLCGVA